MKRKPGVILVCSTFQVIVNVQAFHVGALVNSYRNQQLCMTPGIHDESASGDPRRNKRIVFIRHGRTYMNDFINGIHYGQPGFTDVFPDTKEYKEKYYDSPLGPRGVEQVKLLKDRLQRLSRGDVTAKEELSLSCADANFLVDLDLVVTSPLTRALQTMERGLYPILQSRNIPVVASPQAAERLYMVSDTGKTRHELKQGYSYVDFDSAFPPHIGDLDTWHYVAKEDEIENYVEWRPNGQGQVYACLGEPEHRFEERMQTLYEWLDARPEKTIALVCHAGVILWFLGELVDNCDIRVIDFEGFQPKRLYEVPKDQAILHN